MNQGEEVISELKYISLEIMQSIRGLKERLGERKEN